MIYAIATERGVKMRASSATCYGQARFLLPVFAVVTYVSCSPTVGWV